MYTCDSVLCNKVTDFSLLKSNLRTTTTFKTENVWPLALLTGGRYSEVALYNENSTLFLMSDVDKWSLLGGGCNPYFTVLYFWNHYCCAFECSMDIILIIISKILARPVCKAQ
jgi:hypothetical protein